MLWDSSCSPSRRSKQPKPRGQLLQSLSGARSQDCRCLACSILVKQTKAWRSLVALGLSLGSVAC